MNSLGRMVASCYGCHSRNGAVEWTFTQFYPAQPCGGRCRNWPRTGLRQPAGAWSGT
jgi:hypothetical protein